LVGFLSAGLGERFAKNLMQFVAGIDYRLTEKFIVALVLVG
jgi:hypothetical protein